MTEITLHGARPAGAPHPRLGYAMVTAASALFAVNGTVSKIILTESGISNLRLTELRATGAFLGLAAFVLATTPGRLRVTRDEVPLLVFYGIVGFALVQWLYLVAIERLPIGIGLLLEFTAPVLVALWARLVWHEPVRQRVWAALALALSGLVLVGAGVARRPARHGRRRRRPARRGRPRDYYLAGEHQTARRDALSLTCLSLGVAALFWAVAPAVVGLPVRRARHARLAGRGARLGRRARVGALPLDDRARARSCRSCSRSGRFTTSRRRRVATVVDDRGAARRARRVGLARRVALGRAARRRCGRPRRRSARPDVALTPAVPCRRERDRASSSPLRAATARVSSAPSRRWSGHSSTTAHPSTCASRSSTTSTSCATSRRGARSSSRRRPTSRAGATVVYSAHGVAPSVHESSRALGHDVIDATCPLVTKVHVQAKRYAAYGYTVLLIGHEGHEEVVGTMGEAPDATVLVQDVAEAEALDLPAGRARSRTSRRRRSRSTRPQRSSASLRRRFPGIVRAEEGGHLLRDVQPPVGREGHARRDRPAARDRLAQLVELEPARRRRARRRRARAPDRRRDRDRGGAGWRASRRSASRRAPPRPSGSSPACATGSAHAACDGSSRSGWSTRT